MNLFLLFILISSIFCSSISYPQKLIVDRHKQNDIRVSVNATFNDFEAVTKAIDGYIILNSKTDSNNFDFKVNLDSIDTGIGLRNKHLRDDLNTDKYPDAEFKGSSVILDSLNSIEYNATASGTFSINGVTKNVSVPGKLYNYGSLKKITAELDLKLSEFNIDRPSFLFNKVHDDVKLKLVIYLRAETYSKTN